MEYRVLGRTGVKVSALALVPPGAMVANLFEGITATKSLEKVFIAGNEVR